ncbi:MAG: carboxylesterase/lipase family protein, partial [Asticcacaulis sp.]|nr:carboxylesterase/lipase family protein [Asticcacaulis sp.]
ELGEDYSGNAGMQDIVMSLQWVRDNIERFGGDPSNVMVFGESGGGAKVGTLLGMPSAKGLYHRAGIASGAALRRTPRAAAAETAKRLMKALDITDARKLFDVPAHTLLELQWAGEKGQGGLAEVSPGWADAPSGRHPSRGFAESTLPGHFGPVVDGHVLPADPFAGGVTDVCADIPLMIGHCREEARFFFMGQPEVFAMDDAGLETRVRSEYGDWADRLLATYRAAWPDFSPSSLYVAIATARAFGSDTVTLAGLKAQQSAPVYRYRWDYRSNRPIANDTAILGAGHATDIGPIFDNWDMDGLHGNAPDVKAAAENLSALWASFARTGKPSTPGAPDWPRYDTSRRATMLVDSRCRVVDDPDGAERKLWESLG